MDNAPQERFQLLHEIVAAARNSLSPNMWDYVVGAAVTEATARRNRQALDRIGFRPRVLNDVSSIDPTHRFLGRTIRLPVALAPVGGLDQMDRHGGITVAQGANLGGVPFFLSSVTERRMEDVAAAAPDVPKIFQLYVRGDHAWVDEHATRAIEAGFDAFCITVDSAIYSRRERDIAKRFVKPWRANAAASFQAATTWDDVARFKQKHRIKLILKGIATAEDAERACQVGVDGVYVSNHGGRQLDHGAGSAEVLGDILRTIDRRAFTIVDGGVSRGSDIVKFIAMGADLVGMGRLYCYGLAAAGAEGVARVVELLEIEVAECLGLLGVTSFAQLDPTYLRPVEPVGPAHTLSAFPLLAPITP